MRKDKLEKRKVEKGKIMENKSFTEQDLLEYDNFILSSKFDEMLTFAEKRCLESNNNIWHLVFFGSALHENQKYDESFEIISTAILEDPDNIFIRWHLACAYYSLDNLENAEVVFNEIVNSQNIDYNYYSILGGQSFINSIINDSRYRLAQVYFYSNKKQDSMFFLSEYKSHVNSGIETMYSLKEIDREFKN